MKILTPEQIADEIKGATGAGFLESRYTEWPEGMKGFKSRQIWIKVDRESLRAAVKKIIELHFPHAAVISFADTGPEVDLMYHLYIYWSVPREEILVTIKVSLPKSDLKVPTITDLIPGALTSEREKQEMLGIEVTGIPDGRRLFLPDDFPQGVYPWRKDETGIPPDMIKDLWATGRENLTFEDNFPAPAANPPPAT